MTDDILKRKEEFKSYLKTLQKDDGTVYSDTQITAFCYALEQATSKLKVSTPLVQSNVFAYEDIKAFNRAYAIIAKADNYAKVDMATGNRVFSTALLMYSNYLKERTMYGRKSQIRANFSNYFATVISTLQEIHLNNKVSQGDDYDESDNNTLQTQEQPTATFGQIIEAFMLRFGSLSNVDNSVDTNNLIFDVKFAVTYLKLVRLIEIVNPDNSNNLTVDSLINLTPSGNIIQIDNNVAYTIFNDGLKKIRNKHNKPRSKRKYWFYPVDPVLVVEQDYDFRTGQVVKSKSNGPAYKISSVKLAEFIQKNIVTIPFGELGDLRGYTSKTDIKLMLSQIDQDKQPFGNSSNYNNASSLTWQFAHDMQIGDIIILGQNDKVLACGIVTSEYGYDDSVEISAITKDNHNHTREVKWVHLGEWSIGATVNKLPKNTKSLLDITKYLGYLESVNLILDNFFDELSEPKLINNAPLPHGSDYFLKDVFMQENEYLRLVTLLKNKKNIILQGASGVGKTFLAKKLALSLIGEFGQASNQVKMIQFHPNYTYEDFLMGYRTTQNGMELHHGVFYNFCKKAELDDDNDYFLIIDEITGRSCGNLAKIFGELYVLLENDKRGEEIQLTYSNELFSIPPNLYIIGTASYELDLMDVGMHRRFGFYELLPAFDSLSFLQLQTAVDDKNFNRIIQEIKVLNKEIELDENLGKGFVIGHSYFSNPPISTNSSDDNTSLVIEWLLSILDFEIIPLLEKYWFDEPNKVYEWKKTRNELKEAIK